MNPQGFKSSRAFAIAKKEVAHILRDKFTLALALLMPLVVIFLFGVAIEFNQRDIATAYLDQDQSQSSRALLETFGASQYFQPSAISSFTQVDPILESGQAKTVLIIPPQFEKDLLAQGHAEVQILVNAADNQAAASILSYLSEIQARAQKRILEKSLLLNSGQMPPAGIELKTRFLYNPELNSKWFTVPGLMVIIMTMIAILLTALTVAREWESGSMELLLSTPAHPLEIILGKLAPYAVLCLSAVGLVYLSARLVFAVPFTGNHFAYLTGCFLFLMAYLAQGLMISVLTRQQMLAMQLSMISGLLPSQLLSGFIFPIENMPTGFQKLTMILPARWFMEISRQSFLQGAGFWQMRTPLLALSLITVIFVTIAVKKFKKDLEP